MYKMVVFDIDGTLVPHLSHTFAHEIEDMMQKLKRRGYLVVLATGRDWISIGNLYQNPYVDYYIGANGSFIYDLKEQRYLFQSIIDWKEFQLLSEEILENNINTLNGIILSDAHHVYVKEYEVKDNWFWEVFRPRFKPYERAKEELDRTQFHLVTIEQKKHNDLLSKIMKFTTDHQFNLTVQSHWPSGIFMANKGVNKASAIKKLCHLLDFKINQVIAFGDGENDLEMIKEVGHGVAMGNAVEQLKKVANDITINVEEFGTKFYLKKLGII